MEQLINAVLTWLKGAGFQAVRRMPEGERAIFDYLSSGICKGVGPTTARRIVDRFGLETLSLS